MPVGSSVARRLRRPGTRPVLLSLFMAAALASGGAAAPSAADEPRATTGQPASPPPGTPAVDRHSPRDGTPFLGKADAKRTLTFFIDYQCPVCPRAAREMPALVESFGGLLKVEIKHNPLSMHRQALDAAAAARAAQRQGRFWEYHDLLLDTRRFDRDDLLALADRAGLDREAFQKDFDDAGLREEIMGEAHEAVQAGAAGTPGFIINGHAEVGWASLPWLQGIVRRYSE